MTTVSLRAFSYLGKLLQSGYVLGIHGVSEIAGHQPGAL